MIKLKSSLRDFVPYFVNNKDFRIKLDANEVYYTLLPETTTIDTRELFRYPDSDSTLLRETIAPYYHCHAKNILVGNGSSNIIHMIINGFCEPGDSVLTFRPGFSMYQAYVDLNNCKVDWLEAEKDFSQNISALIDRAKKIKPKIVLVCNPNNPTGYVNAKEDLVQLLKEIPDSLILVDEAYADFSEVTCLDLINDYDHLVVARTLSKAMGLANLRVGFAIGNEDLIYELWKLKPPYNMSGINETLAIQAASNLSRLQSFLDEVKVNRERLSGDLKSMGMTVYPSGANFLFVASPIVNLDVKLEERKVLIRAFHHLRNDSYYRITVGSQEENQILIDVLQEVQSCEKE